VTTSDNAVVWRWDSDAFGTTAANENPVGLGVYRFDLRFPGQQFDVETGLTYNYYRDYDAATGRYLESDPSGLQGGLDTYSYAAGSPIRYIDPDGRVPNTPCMRLRLLVWLACKGFSRRCTALDSCEELIAKHQLALRCMELQAIHTSQCFADRPSHRQVITDALARARNCIGIYLSKGCTTCGVPP
jgi:RHS repeat-associated protein